MNIPPPALPGYRIGRRLGAGARTTVWAATRAEDGQRCAVKLLPLEDGEAGHAEADLLAGIDDPHVVRLLDVRETEAGVALVTERFDGGSLERTVLQRRRLSPAEVSTVLVPVLEALSRLHARGIVHGDLAPGNVLFDSDGRPVLTDLGAARLAGHPGAGAATPGYAAPEVLDGEDPGPAADVWSVGALAWYALTGHTPDPPVMREPLADAADVGADLAELVELALSIDPAERPGAADLAARLRQVAAPAPVNLASGSDPGQALTVRLRESAASEADAERPRTSPARRRLARSVRWLRRHAVHLLVTIGLLLIAVGAAGWMLPGPDQAPPVAPGGTVGQRTGGAPTTTAPAPGTAATATSAAPAGGVAPRSSAPSAPGGPSPTSSPSGTTTAAAAAPPASSAPHGTSAAQPVVPVPGATEPNGVLRDRSAPQSRPSELLRALLALRGAAWRSGEPGNLLASEEPGSPAHLEDSAALRRARATGVSLPNLVFTMDATVAPAARGAGASDEAVLTALVGRAASTASTTAGPRPVPAEPAARTTITVSWTDGGWRLHSWRPVG